MNVLALNSSARAGSESKTEILLLALVEGMTEAGAKVEVVNLKHKKITPCVGCFTCWTKTPGICALKDDMTRELYPKWAAADLCVYATPLFHHTVNAVMKAFIERTLPIAEPFLIHHNGAWSHPLRQEPPPVVVLSVCGFPSASAFEALIPYVRYLFGRKEGRLWAEIYRSGADAMVRRPDVLEDILQNTRKAGKELILEKRIRPETLTRITRDLPLEPDSYAELINCFWRNCIGNQVTPKEFRDRKIPFRPDSLTSFMGALPMGLNHQKVQNVKATIQFEFSGEVTGVGHFLIQDGRMVGRQGPADHPDLVIQSPFEVWMDIQTGKIDGGQAFMDRKYTVQGDSNLLVQFKDWFQQD